jgi:hypothetical protein
MDIFGIVRGNFVYFSPVLVFCTKKNLVTLGDAGHNQGDQIVWIFVYMQDHGVLWAVFKLQK